jgi:hypothetical protein
LIGLFIERVKNYLKEFAAKEKLVTASGGKTSVRKD